MVNGMAQFPVWSQPTVTQYPPVQVVTVVEQQPRGPPHCHAKPIAKRRNIIIEDDDEEAKDLDGACHQETGLIIKTLPLTTNHAPNPFDCSDMPGLVSDSDGSVDLLDSVSSDSGSETSAGETSTTKSTVSSCSGSSDSEPVSRKARNSKYRAEQLSLSKNRSARDGLTATIDQLTTYAPSCQAQDEPADLLNLWSALPPNDTQFLDLAARLDSGDVSDRSTRYFSILVNDVDRVAVVLDFTCSESGQLTPGFISETDDCFNTADQVPHGTTLTLWQAKTMMRFLPITSKQMLDFGV